MTITKARLEHVSRGDDRRKERLDARLARMPKFVRDEIEARDQKIAQLEELLKVDETKQTNTGILDILKGATRPLPDCTRVRFTLSKETVDVYVNEGALRVQSTTGVLVVLPGASNSISVRSRPTFKAWLE